MLSCGTECCLKSGGDDDGNGSTSKKLVITLAPSGHRLRCTALEADGANCRNGGTCYVVVLQNYHSTGCRYCSSVLFALLYQPSLIYKSSEVSP